MFPDQNQPGGNSAPQQGPNGQYQVVPPLPVGQNNGHSGHNPYEFIVNPQAQHHHHGKLIGSHSFLKQIATIVGAAVVIVVVLAVAVVLFAPKSNTAGLTAIAERQQEIVRVATETASQVSSQAAKNFVANTEVSVASGQNQLLAYLKSHHVQLGSKQLAIDQNAQTDTLLSNAAATNNYDNVAVQSLTSQLQTYQGLLQTSYKQSSNPKLKQLIQASHNAAGLLLTQAKNISN